MLSTLRLHYVRRVTQPDGLMLHMFKENHSQPVPSEVKVVRGAHLGVCAKVLMCSQKLTTRNADMKQRQVIHARWIKQTYSLAKGLS